jgi:hypothetical protein
MTVASEEQAQRLDRIAEEGARMVDHARAAAAHFRSGDIPRAGAHALALNGHLVNVRAIFDSLSTVHASKSEP